MPELPDVTVYCERLWALVGGATLERIRLRSPFLVRSYDPPITAANGRVVTSVERLGKRIVIGLEPDLFLVLHLMIAGRLHWKPPGVALSNRRTLAAFDFAAGSVLLTEASTQQRASLYLVRGRDALAEHDRGGIEPLTASLEEFRERLLAENRTLKRMLTNPRSFSGIGNAYSDEILHAARLSPVKLTSRLTPEELERLHRATIDTLEHWTRVLRADAGDGLPEKVTAFRPDMAVHGRYKRPCPVCNTLVQRIRYASNEVNYCPRCQTDGKLLADRSLSRLLHGDWPASIDEWEAEQRALPRAASAPSAAGGAREVPSAAGAKTNAPSKPGASPRTISRRARPAAEEAARAEPAAPRARKKGTTKAAAAAKPAKKSAARAAASKRRPRTSASR